MTEKIHKETFSWVKRIEHALKESSSIVGGSPSLDWGKLSEILSERFDTKVQVKSKDLEFRSSEEVEDGFGSSPISCSFALTPISGHVHWIMDKEEVGKLTRWMLTRSATSKGFSSFALQEGFYHYLLLEVLDLLPQLPLFQNYTPKLSNEGLIEKNGAVCLDISIQLDKTSCWGRLAIPTDFLQAFKEQYKGDLATSELAKNAEVLMSLNIGKTLLDARQFQKLSKGDFVLLDSIHYDVDAKEGRGIMALEHVPLFQVKLTPSQIQLVDQAYTQEESMEENEESAPPPEEAPTPPSPEAEAVEAVEEEGVSIKKVPISLTVELARLRIPLEKLMRLEPGLFLELPTHPEQGVNLTVNGKKVGKGELVSLGETMGVRILEI